MLHPLLWHLLLLLLLLLLLPPSLLLLLLLLLLPLPLLLLLLLLEVSENLIVLIIGPPCRLPSWFHCWLGWPVMVNLLRSLVYMLVYTWRTSHFCWWKLGQRRTVCCNSSRHIMGDVGL